MTEIKDRIAAKRAAKAELAALAPPPSLVPEAPLGSSAPPASASAAAKPRLSRAERFASRDLDDEMEPDHAALVPLAAKQHVSTPEQHQQLKPQPAPLPADEPVSRAERFAARARQAQHAHVAAVVAPTEQAPAVENLVQKLPEWDDPRRPAGSAYSIDEWLQAEADFPDCAIMEVVKPRDRGLIAKARDAMDVVLHRSMVIDQRVASSWHSMASAQIEHHGEFGISRYSIVRSAEQLERASWADGSKMVMRDVGFEEDTPTRNSRPRGERFRG